MDEQNNEVWVETTIGAKLSQLAERVNELETFLNREIKDAEITADLSHDFVERLKEIL